MALDPGGRRLAFSRLESDADIVRIAIGQPPVTLISSSSDDQQGTFSEDGRRIAFSSSRSGTIAVWVAEADGSAPRQLTHGGNRHEASPKWSPDGTRVAFDSQSADGHWHIRVIDAEGGEATQLTFEPDDQNIPFWSQRRQGGWTTRTATAMASHACQHGAALPSRLSPAARDESPRRRRMADRSCFSQRKAIRRCSSGRWRAGPAGPAVRAGRGICGARERHLLHPVRRRARSGLYRPARRVRPPGSACLLAQGVRRLLGVEPLSGARWECDALQHQGQHARRPVDD